MAIPRVFISSTFYDLRQVREDIERFILDLGYEPVRNETGGIPYGKDDHPEAYAYREIELCDIVVSIIGGRFGTESHQDQSYSISQKELRTALERGIQVFIFIERNVMGEYSTYQLNRESETTKYQFVDNKKVYEFIEEMHKLPRNNPIAPFDTSADIIKYLKLQWAGLFQRFLREQQRLAEMRILEELNSTAATLKQLVNFLTEERRNKDEAIKSILFANHPMFRKLSKITSANYRIYFTNKVELEKWLHARRFNLVPSSAWDDWDFEEWYNEDRKERLKIKTSIFDDNGKLKVIDEDEWEDDWIRIEKPTKIITDDDIPF